MAQFKTVTDFCPEQNEYETIEIKYFHVPRLNAEAGYKKDGFSCTFGAENGCSYEDRRECPLYNDAPITL